MEVEVSGVKPSAMAKIRKENSESDRVLVKRKTLQAVLQQCQRALELLDSDSSLDDDDSDGENGDGSDSAASEGEDRRGGEADELCELLKSRVECPDFLEKLACAQASVSQNLGEEGNSWDLVSENDLWEGENTDLNEDEYVLVRQEDILEGIACFMTAYLESIKETKDLPPNQLQEALRKTFSVKKKGQLRKAWEGSKVIYNVASWGATAVGIYQNPVIIRAASKAFWTSCHVISKLL